ncbi:MAG: zinc ribbon domain-containing protein [Betaproteobacteria bacterium]|nr:zinc ribbon domain-containing protein [Betaproteobacteria bacterium]
MEIVTRTKAMPPFPLRCPSCDHGNPVSAKFCNNCGLPVHLQPCSNCEAINDRTANRCYKCGSPLSLMSVLQPRSATPAPDTIVSPSSADWTIADPGTPVSRPAIESGETTTFSSSADPSIADADTPVSRPAMAAADMSTFSSSADPSIADPDTPVSRPAIAAAETTDSSSSADQTIVDPGTPVSRPAIAAAETTDSSSSADQTIVDPGTPVPEEPARYFYDATVDGDGAAISSAAEHTITMDQTLAPPPRELALRDHVATVPRSWESIHVVVAKRRRPGVRAAVAAVMLVALAIPAYLAHEDPAWLRERFDVFTTRFDKPSVQSASSPQVVPADNTASQQTETAPAPLSPQDPALSSRAPPVETTGAPQSPAVSTASEPQSPWADTARELPMPASPKSQPPSAGADRESQLSEAARASTSPAASTASEGQSLALQAVGEPKLVSPATRATPRPQAAKNGRQSSVRSTAARSKQSNVSRTPVSPKASDARTRVKFSDARRTEPKEKAATRRAATRPGRLPATAEPSPIND